MSIQLLPDIHQRDAETGNGESIVIVYNNDHNTYEEVIGVLQRATCCSFEEAWMEAWEIDHLGKSIVHHGGEEECERAAGIIRTIGIHVEVRDL